MGEQASTSSPCTALVLRPERAEMSARGSSDVDDGNAAGGDGKRLGDAFWRGEARWGTRGVFIGDGVGSNRDRD